MKTLFPFTDDPEAPVPTIRESLRTIFGGMAHDIGARPAEAQEESDPDDLPRFSFVKRSKPSKGASVSDEPQPSTSAAGAASSEPTAEASEPASVTAEAIGAAGPLEVNPVPTGQAPVPDSSDASQPAAEGKGKRTKRGRYGKKK